MIFRADYGILCGNVYKHWVFLCRLRDHYTCKATSALLNRSFRNVPRAATSKTECTGICHLCLAGRPPYDYENMFLNFSMQLMSVDFFWNGGGNGWKIVEKPNLNICIFFIASWGHRNASGLKTQTFWIHLKLSMLGMKSRPLPAFCCMIHKIKVLFTR